MELNYSLELEYRMPRKTKISTVPVESLPEGTQTKGQESKQEGLDVAREAIDDKTDAEQMTKLINLVKEEPNETTVDA